MSLPLDNLRSFVGVFFILGLAWLLSSARHKTPLRVVAIAIGLQIAIGLLAFSLPPLRSALNGVSLALKALQTATAEGSRFVFGYLAGAQPPFETTSPDNGFILAFQVLPLMIVISALAALFWHWGVLSRICKGLGYLLERSLGLSGPVGLGAAASVFLGMVEAPLIVRPYLERMSRADIFLIMTASMATIAGTMMAIYIALMQQSVPEAAAHVLVASLMAAPGAVAIARIMQPPEDASGKQDAKPPPKLYQSSMDAFCRGVQDGLNIFMSVIAILLVSVAFVALINMALASLLPPIQGESVTLGHIFGWMLAPIMFMLGFPWEDCADAGMLMGTKTALNELLAFIELAGLPPGAMEPRSRLMMIYLLCGFANFGALAIMIGGLSAMCPARRSDFLDLGLKSLVSGTLTNMMNGALIGIAPTSLLMAS